MTVIVGLVHQGQVHMGGDTGSVSPSGRLLPRADPKIFHAGPYLIGFTDSFRMGQLLRYRYIPDPPPDGDLDQWMCVEFVNAVQTCLTTGGWSGPAGPGTCGRFLVGVAGQLYLVDGDYQIAKPADPYVAIGAGEQVASGALYATVGLDPKSRINIALQAAERYCTDVRGPYVHLHQPDQPSPATVLAPVRSIR